MTRDINPGKKKASRLPKAKAVNIVGLSSDSAGLFIEVGGNLLKVSFAVLPLDGGSGQPS